MTEFLKRSWRRTKSEIGALHEGVSLDYDLIAEGKIIKKYDLENDGGGIANPEVAKKYGLGSALCYPLYTDGRLTGFLNHFSSSNRPFTTKEEGILKLFSQQAENIIRQANQSLSLKITKNLVSDLLSLSPNEFLVQLPNRSAGVLDDCVCLVWKLNPAQKKLRIIAASDSVDESYRQTELDYSFAERLLTGRRTRYLPNVTISKEYQHAQEARERGWVSLLSIPMFVEDDLVGLLDIYTKFPHYFRDYEKELFEELATLSALSIQKADLQRETTESSTHRHRLETINRAMTAMSEERDVEKILRLLLTNSLRLVGVNWGWVRRLNPSTGELEVTSKIGTSDTPRPLKFSEGINWKAIIEREPQLAEDVQSDKWKDWYVEFSSETRSELAIPLVLDNVLVREGSKTKLRSRAIGVLNLESPEVGAFHAAHLTYLWPLIRQAALLIDRVEAEQKAAGLREVEREIVGKMNWREVLETVVKGITGTLGFERVNVSLVDAAKNVIKSEYIVGIPDDEVEVFKKMAIHSLDSKDIQADIVRTRKIEVPEQNDSRFDSKIFEQFKHQDLIRVFMPMIAASSGEVIGTIEAGYERSYRDFIYERDIGFLQSFISYAVEAIEPSRLALLETVSHELRSSIVGIRSNAEYLKFLGANHSEYLKSLSNGFFSEMMINKLHDILADSEILLLNVGELEYFMGRTSPAAKIEETWVVRDILIKTVNQLKPLVRERRFDPKRIEYPRFESGRIRIFVEKARLNQVVFNLLLNSIKYAEDSPDKFSIEISISERKGNFIIKFVDWGMGIKPGLEQKIFEYGFRTPEARAKNVSGSGLGLTIAKDRMLELGGDLLLTHNHHPTEFQMWIPKKLMEAPR